MLPTQRFIAGATKSSSRSLIQSCVFKRYSSSSSSSSSSPDEANSSQAQEAKDLENETEIKASSVGGSLKSPISTQAHTSSIESSSTPTPQQDSTPSSFVASSPKHTSQSKRKSSKSTRSKPLTYNLPYVPSTQHLNVDRIFEDSLYQGFRPLTTPIKDMKKYISLAIPAPPAKNNKAYWNTSACQVEEFSPLDSVPKFIGDGMKAFKAPQQPGNEIRIYPRDDRHVSSDPLSKRFRKYVQKELEKERRALDKKKITAFRYYDDIIH